MRISAGLVWAIVLSTLSCAGPPAGVCAAGAERCPCIEHQCDTGLTCVNETCFDLSWLQPGGIAGSDAASGGTVAVSMPVLTGVPTPAASSSSAAAGVSGMTDSSVTAAGSVGSATAGVGAAADSGSAGGAGAAAGSVSAAGAGAVASTLCSPAGGDCSTQGCCNGTPCVNNVCAASCSLPQECASACCRPLSPGAAPTCAPTTLCQGQSAGAAP